MSRNLVHYPLTKAEVILCLTQIVEKLATENRIGDLDCYILERATHVIIREFDHKDFNPTP